MKKFTGNKGFSLIELLVVVAIMAIALTMISLSIAVVFSNNVRSAANSVDSVLSKAKVNANYRAPIVFVEFAVVGENIIGRYYEGYVAGEGTASGLTIGTPATFRGYEVLGKSSINVSVTGFSANGTRDLATNPIVIGIERGTGRLLEGTPDGGGYVFAPFSGTQAVISLGNTTSTYNINLTTFTGKHEVSR